MPLPPAAVKCHACMAREAVGVLGLRMHSEAAGQILVRRPESPISGAWRPPGDALIGQWALLCALLAVGESRISGLSEAADFPHVIAALRALGARVQRPAPGIWQVAGCGLGGVAEPARVLQVGQDAGFAQMLAGLLAGHPIFAVLDGEARLGATASMRLIGALRGGGARLRGHRDGGLPLAVIGARDAVPLDVAMLYPSAQLKAALLLCGLNAGGLSRIVEPEATQDHGEIMLRHFGAEISVQPEGRGATIRLHGQPELRAATVIIPGDATVAAFPVVAALLVPGSALRVRGVGLNPSRGALFDALQAMGARITSEPAEAAEPIGDLVVQHGRLRAADTDWHAAPGLVQTYPLLAAAAALAEGTSRLCGLGAVRKGERARMAAVAVGLRQCGVQAVVEDDDLLIHGSRTPPAGGAGLAHRGDPFLAMAGLVLGLVAAAPIRVDDTAGLERWFPGFQTEINGLLAAGSPPALVAA